MLYILVSVPQQAIRIILQLETHSLPVKVIAMYMFQNMRMWICQSKLAETEGFSLKLIDSPRLAPKRPVASCFST